MNQPEIANPPKEGGSTSPKKTGCLGCLFHPFIFLLVGGFMLFLLIPIKFMDVDYFDDWMERSVKADKWSSGIITMECNYENCTNNSAWEIDFIPWGDLTMPDNPNFPGTRSHTYQSSEKSVRREENTYLVPEGDKIKVETKKEWKEYDTPVTKSYDKFQAHYCDEHIDAAQKLIWDTIYWEHYKYTFIGIGVGAVLFAVGLVRLLLAKAKGKKNKPAPSGTGAANG